MKIAIADDHQAVIDGLVSKLINNTDVSIIGTFSNGDDLLNFLKQKEVDLIISDLGMPGTSGLALLTEIQEINPKTKLIFLTMHDDAELVKVLLDSGLSGYVLKNSPLSELMRCIWQIGESKYFICRNTEELLKTHKNLQSTTPKLTKREIQILKLVASDYRNKEIAEMLNIELSTVETHKKNLLRKLNAKSAITLTKYAIENKII